ncbi:RagB/SusD family nutrient uptake outer membrane protein [Pedobacter aquatilis]|uniref:RagB/SusD family nutrient uptake outer membrane protein n=1 Tax=Pedobacter aquatilis TaxID=351343 RepID=UPI002931B9D9|nr:RagB/SusD family nutrient uptake outer membrane protein [Pedobacter aquatilis]
MKKTFLNRLRQWVLLIALFSVLSVSCKKFLEPEPVSSFSQNFVFSNVPYAKSAVIGIYNSLSTQNAYGLYLSGYYPYDTDEMMGAGGNQRDNERRDLARYNIISSNGGLSTVYSNCYAGIERANICIQQIPLMDLYNNGSPQQKAQLRRLHGEALALRAQFYFDLIKHWGDVPATFSPSAESTDLFLPKTNRDSIYNRIIEDLKTAADLVPWRTQVPTLGDVADERLTKGGIKALRARIALARGGYSLRRESKQMERRADYLKFYAIARDECAEIISRRDQHTLNPSYKSVWKDYVCSRIANEPNGEIMFQVAEGGATGTTDGRIGIYNGTRFAGVGGGSPMILPTYYYSFDSTDVRRDVTAAPYETKTDGINRTGHAITSIYDGKYRREWWANPTNPTNATLFSGINWVLIRFSDVLLMYAESVNEINRGATPEAVAAVAEVSRRGHAGNNALVPAIPTDYLGFFKFIVRERYLEFGSEGIRKYDLIRWNLLQTALNETRVNLGNFGAATPVAMNAPTYMASPASYCLVNTLPQGMFYFNATSADDSRIWANSLYQPAPLIAPAGTTRVPWVGYNQINPVYTSLFAFAFQPNKSELYPIYVNVINASAGVLTQDYGY